jgi:allophanate hydrolase subunit 1
MTRVRFVATGEEATPVAYGLGPGGWWMLGTADGRWVSWAIEDTTPVDEGTTSGTARAPARPAKARGK